MNIYRDYDLTHKVEGFETIAFSSEADARAAIALADQMLSQAMSQEYRNRKAAASPSRELAEVFES